MKWSLCGDWSHFDPVPVKIKESWLDCATWNKLSSGWTACLRLEWNQRTVNCTNQLRKELYAHKIKLGFTSEDK